MARTAWPTVLPGDAWTSSQHNTYGKDNEAAHWPYTSAGDLPYATSSTALSRLAIGANGTILKSTGSAPAWLAAGGAGTIMYNNGASTPAWLALGTSGYVLKSNGTAPAWASADLEFASVYHNTTQNVSTGTPTVLTFNAETDDTQGWHSTVTNASRITVTTTGYYMASYYIGYAGAGGSGSYYDTLELLQGGSTTVAQCRWNVGDDAYSKFYSGSFPIAALSATNYIELRFEQNSGDTRAILANARFTLLRIA